ncbi:hypothetical protein Daus18300_002280 [Diaporthe australafricana]|uniref:Myb-like domain-containing protein n=1 Tax=Diaporthe australafricana TaxID=127596 RepID=A0ABR3XQQ8_9PEZI
MTNREVSHPDFTCSTPGCGEAQTILTAEQEETELQRARDHAKRFLRETHEDCLSLCILPFIEEAIPSVESTPEPPVTGFRPVNKPNPPGLHGKSRPWSKKRGQQWGREEEVALWKLRRQGMEFSQIARQIDRTERGCYDRYNKLRNEGFGRQ